MVVSNILLEQSNGATFPMSISLDAKVYELKRQIGKKMKTHESNLLIYFCGDVLENSSTLASNGITSGQTLALEMCTPKCLTVSLPNAENIVVRVDLNALKEDVIRAIEEQYPHPSGTLALITGDREWPAKMKVSSLNEQDDIRVVVQEKGGSR